MRLRIDSLLMVDLFLVDSNKDFALLEKVLTPERVQAHFAGIVHGPVECYALPQLGALNFVMHNALGGGVTRSLALDAHGKCLSSKLLDLVLE